MDIKIDIPKGWLISSSTNSFRKAFVHSNVSSMAYADWIQALANNSTWTKQVNIGELQSPLLFYVSLKKEINDICISQDLELLVILYITNQPVDAQL